ncbi:MAG: ABC-2 family transporter protein [Candidatus Pacearchaeota archaeon]|nr:ABC-2 family transporter protein [Candidatus Pacearchaeota archaeon]
MISYLSLIKVRLLSLLQYKAAALAGVFTQLFWGFIRVMIFQAFYLSTNKLMPMSSTDAITYIWLGQAFLLLVPWNMDKEMMSLIRTGNVAYEMIRPLDCYWYWFAKAFGFRTAPVLLRAIPLFIIVFPFFGMGAPAGIFALGAFFISLCFAILLSSAITVLINITLFWTISGAGIYHIFPSLMMMLSGLIIPLPLFPEWLQSIIKILPFRGIIDSPFRLYMGHINYTQLPEILIHQGIWIFLIIILGRFLLSRGLKKITIQGG